MISKSLTLNERYFKYAFKQGKIQIKFTQAFRIKI